MPDYLEEKQDLVNRLNKAKQPLDDAYDRHYTQKAKTYLNYIEVYNIDKYIPKLENILSKIKHKSPSVTDIESRLEKYKNRQ